MTVRRAASLLIILVAALGMPGAVTASDTPPDMRSDLLACWDFDESSGVRLDSAGSTNLTDNNTVTRRIGLHNWAAQFNALNSESLSNNTTDALNLGSASRTVVLWVYALDTTSVYLLHRGNDFSILTNGTSQLRYSLWDPGTAALVSYGTSVLPGSQWVMLAIHNTPAGASWYEINRVRQTFAVRPSTNVTTGQAYIGHSTYTGLIDSSAVFEGELDESQLDYLYNDGAGRTCAEILAADGTVTAASSEEVSLDDEVSYIIDRRFSWGDVALFGGMLVLYAINVVQWMVSEGIKWSR